MSDSLWDLTSAEVLRRTSSTDPTPGGGAIAAVTAALGLGLVEMALEVTVSASAGAAIPEATVGELRHSIHDLRAELVGAADRDSAAFEALMRAYRLPRETEVERIAREAEIERALVRATDEPVRLAEACVVAIGLSDQVEPLVKPTILSDVRAGCDLLRGAALAAVHTVDVNLAPLEQRGSSHAAGLRRRRDAASRAAAGSRADR